MKRSSELAVLSREHHVALEVALRMQRADEKDVVAVAEAALAFWHQEGREHFRLEEEVLLPPFVREVGDDDSDVARVLAEHADITQRMSALERDGSAVPVNTLGELLRDHVRHEERILFGRIEAALDPDELAEVGAELRVAGDSHRLPRA